MGGSRTEKNERPPKPSTFVTGGVTEVVSAKWAARCGKRVRSRFVSCVSVGLQGRVAQKSARATCTWRLSQFFFYALQCDVAPPTGSSCYQPFNEFMMLIGQKCISKSTKEIPRIRSDRPTVLCPARLCAASDGPAVRAPYRARIEVPFTASAHLDRSSE